MLRKEWQAGLHLLTGIGLLPDAVKLRSEVKRGVLAVPSFLSIMSGCMRTVSV